MPEHLVQRDPQTDYAEYLRIDDLLGLQEPLTPGAHDELLFIVIHQAYELWFKLLLHELASARDLLLVGSALAALAPLRRVAAVERVLLEQVSVLETMTPEGFLRFRDPLAPASGFQSSQFREIQALSGDPHAEHVLRLTQPGQGRSRVEARVAEPTLWDGFLTAGRAAGLDLPAGPQGRERRVDALAGLHRDHATPKRAALHLVAEALVDHDEAIARWRSHHMLMAAREIGARVGTGGSQGVGYLRGTLDERFYPELWELRNRL